MYIVPNSKVYILSGIPINNNYQHTIYFDDADAQYAYFRKHVKKTFTGVSYQRNFQGQYQPLPRMCQVLPCISHMCQDLAVTRNESD